MLKGNKFYWVLLAGFLVGCRQEPVSNDTSEVSVPMIVSEPVSAVEVSEPEVTSEIEEIVKKSKEEYKKEVDAFNKEVEALKKHGDTANMSLEEMKKNAKDSKPPVMTDKTEPDRTISPPVKEEVLLETDETSSAL